MEDRTTVLIGLSNKQLDIIFDALTRGNDNELNDEYGEDVVLQLIELIRMEMCALRGIEYIPT